MAYHILASYFSGHSKPSCNKDILRQGSSPGRLSQLSRTMSKEADGTGALSTKMAQLCVIPAKISRTEHSPHHHKDHLRQQHVPQLAIEQYLVGCNQYSNVLCE